MHLANVLARYAEADLPVYRRDPQADGDGNIIGDGTGLISNVAYVE
jgi:hypothetical protein